MPRGSMPRFGRSIRERAAIVRALEGAGLGDGTLAVAAVISRYARPE